MAQGIHDHVEILEKDKENAFSLGRRLVIEDEVWLFLRGHSLEKGKKSASRQIFVPNHSDFDFKRYSLIYAGFSAY